jgi:hypothetical protein
MQLQHYSCLVPGRFGLFTSLSALVGRHARGPRKGRASHRTTHSAWVRGRYYSFVMSVCCSLGNNKQTFVVNIVAPVKLLYEIIILSRVDVITFIVIV